MAQFQRQRPFRYRQELYRAVAPKESAQLIVLGARVKALGDLSATKANAAKYVIAPHDQAVSSCLEKIYHLNPEEFNGVAGKVSNLIENYYNYAIDFYYDSLEIATPQKSKVQLNRIVDIRKELINESLFKTVREIDLPSPLDTDEHKKFFQTLTDGINAASAHIVAILNIAEANIHHIQSLTEKLGRAMQSSGKRAVGLITGAAKLGTMLAGGPLGVLAVAAYEQYRHRRSAQRNADNKAINVDERIYKELQAKQRRAYERGNGEVLPSAEEIAELQQKKNATVPITQNAPRRRGRPKARAAAAPIKLQKGQRRSRKAKGPTQDILSIDVKKDVVDIFKRHTVLLENIVFNTGDLLREYRNQLKQQALDKEESQQEDYKLFRSQNEQEKSQQNKTTPSGIPTNPTSFSDYIPNIFFWRKKPPIPSTPGKIPTPIPTPTKVPPGIASKVSKVAAPVLTSASKITKFAPSILKNSKTLPVIGTAFAAYDAYDRYHNQKQTGLQTALGVGTGLLAGTAAATLASTLGAPLLLSLLAGGLVAKVGSSLMDKFTGATDNSSSTDNVPDQSTPQQTASNVYQQDPNVLDNNTTVIISISKLLRGTYLELLTKIEENTSHAALTPENKSIWTGLFESGQPDIKSLNNRIDQLERSIAQNHGQSAPPTGTPITEQSVADAVSEAMEFLANDQELMLTPEQAAGIVGNLMQESYTNLRPGVQGYDGKHYGLAQWGGSRLTHLQEFLKEQYQLEDFRNATRIQELNFLKHELLTTENNALQALRAAQTTQDAALTTENTFERSGGSHLDKRIDYALNAEATWKQKQPQIMASDVTLMSSYNPTATPAELKPTPPPTAEQPDGQQAFRATLVKNLPNPNANMTGMMRQAMQMIVQNQPTAVVQSVESGQGNSMKLSSPLDSTPIIQMMTLGIPTFGLR